MEREEIESFKVQFSAIMESGRKFWGKEVFDNHIIDVLEFFGFSTEDEIIIEIFGKLERK